MRAIKYIVIHCSDSTNNRVDNRNDGAPEIHRWHIEKGWDGIGYHYVINENGTLQLGRPVWLHNREFWKGSHAVGYNHESIGICLIGENYFHPEQLTILRSVINDLLSAWPDAKVVGHYQLNPLKSCPGIDIPHWLATGEQKKIRVTK